MTLNIPDSVNAVTVIIVNFNGGDILLKTLAALQHQTLQAQRVMVVDNLSTDASINNAAKLFPQFEYIRLTENTGFAAGNNYAIKRSTTDLVALLNPDAFPEPEWLAELIKAAHKHPQAASFGSRQLIDSRDHVIDGVEDVCHISGLVWRGGHGRLRGPRDDVAREIFSPCAAAALYRRDAVQGVGGFDEDFFCYVEDVDLGFRLRLMGWQSRYVPSAVVRHVGSATTGGAHSDFSVYHGHRNLVWMYAKNMPGALLWWLLPLHVMMNLASVVAFVFKGKGKAISRAKLNALAGLPKVWRKRAMIQNSRSVSSLAVLNMLNCKLLPDKRNDEFF